MQKTSKTILAINPGTKYLGIAVFRDADLRNWAVKAVPGKWSERKLVKIQSIVTDLIFELQPDVIAMKSLDPSRRSGNLETIVAEIRTIAGRKNIRIEEYCIEDLKRFFSPDKRINKRQLLELAVAEYPALRHEMGKEVRLLKVMKDGQETERKDLKKYYGRMFEAVVLGAVSLYASHNQL